MILQIYNYFNIKCNYQGKDIYSVLSISSVVKTYKYNFACIAMYSLVPLSPMQACLYCHVMQLAHKLVWPCETTHNTAYVSFGLLG